MEKGYEDIYSETPYLEADGDEESKCYYIDILYTPPELRGKGEGKRLVNEFLASLPKGVERVRLKSCALGSGCTLDFWGSFGFKKAYYGNLYAPWGELDNIMVLGVNGHATPPPEKLTADNNDREMHESKEDIDFIERMKANDLSLC